MEINVAVVIGLVDGEPRRIDVPANQGPAARFTLSIRGGDPLFPSCQDAKLDVLAFRTRADWVLQTLRNRTQVIVKGRLLGLDGTIVIQADWVDFLRGAR